MSPLVDQGDLPRSDSPDLQLSHPTPGECEKIWTSTFSSWGDALPLPVYLKESDFLSTVPLAKDGGMTTWILVDKNLPQDDRPILCSCESFRKRALTSDASGNIEQRIVHGIASVFCPPAYRRRGYAARHMKEMAKALRRWQADESICIGSILYSDIGKTYYAKLGWHPNTTNSHLVLRPADIAKPPLVQDILEDDLAKLCERDEAMVRKAMALPADGVKRRMTIMPDLDHMLWHMGKEDFACDYLFGKIPPSKGAIAGLPGRHVWAIWTHRYYGTLDSASSDNVLYILRLVVEGDESASRLSSDSEKRPAHYDELLSSLKAVLQAAQREAAQWKLDSVKLWEPTPLAQDMISRSEIKHLVVEREEDSIASGFWYDGNGGTAEAPLWINNEHYAWL